MYRKISKYVHKTCNRGPKILINIVRLEYTPLGRHNHNQLALLN